MALFLTWQQAKTLFWADQQKVTKGSLRELTDVKAERASG